MPNPSELARLEEEQGIAGPLEADDLIAAIQTITGHLEDMVPPAGSNAGGPRVPPRTVRKRRRLEVRDSRRANR